jgi:hypothetical protein
VLEISLFSGSRGKIMASSLIEAFWVALGQSIVFSRVLDQDFLGSLGYRASDWGIGIRLHVVKYFGRFTNHD